MELTDPLVQTEVDEYRKAFDLADRDGNGEIDEKELSLLLELTGESRSSQEVRDLLRSVDTDGNGTISFEEFLEMVRRKKSSTDTTELSRMFDTFDKLNTGFITPNELQRVMRDLGEPCTAGEAQAMVAYADTDGDGRVSREEFLAFWSRED